MPPPAGGASFLCGRHLHVGLLLRGGLVEVRVVLGSAVGAVGRLGVRVRRVVVAVSVVGAAPGARVLAEEGRGHERLGREGEVVAVAVAGGKHEGVPDGRGVGSALGARHRDARIRIADPDSRRQARRIAHEPGVLGLVGRPRLAGRRAAVARGGAGAGGHVHLEDLRDLVGLAVRHHALALRVGEPLALAVGEDHPFDARDLVADAAARERRVRVRHLERRDAAG